MTACNSTGMTTKAFETIEYATLKRFPKLDLYKGWGLHAQNLEGQILKDAAWRYQRKHCLLASTRCHSCAAATPGLG